MIGQALSGESVNLNAGGILGYAASWETKGRIVRCYNTGDVQAVMNHEKNSAQTSPVIVMFMREELLVTYIVTREWKTATIRAR